MNEPDAPLPSSSLSHEQQKEDDNSSLDSFEILTLEEAS